MSTTSLLFVGVLALLCSSALGQICDNYWSCSGCVAEAGCGWCKSKGACEPGTSSGPNAGFCGEWDYYSSQCASLTTEEAAGVVFMVLFSLMGFFACLFVLAAIMLCLCCVHSRRATKVVVVNQQPGGGQNVQPHGPIHYFPQQQELYHIPNPPTVYRPVASSSKTVA
ncbi:SMB domain-containing protein [Balamuthia mandrillaris]